MAGVNPLLKIILDTRYRLEAGESLRNALSDAIDGDSDTFALTIKRWLASLEHKGQSVKILNELKSPYRRVFLEIIAKGISGIPIYQALIELESEVRQACDLEIDAKLKNLPFLSLLPVMFLMFPAFLLLLFGPTLTHLIKELSQ